MRLFLAPAVLVSKAINKFLDQVALIPRGQEMQDGYHTVGTLEEDFLVHQCNLDCIIFLLKLCPLLALKLCR